MNAPQDLPLLYDASRRMGAALDAESVVTAYLMQVAAGGRYACTITMYEDAQGAPYPEPSARAQVRVLGAWTPTGGLTFAPMFHPYIHDALDAALDAGETVAVADVRTDARITPTLRRIQEESKRPALALIPLMARGERRMGLVILSASEPQQWTTDDLRRYQITAALLAASLDARIQQKLLHQRGLRLAVFEERQRLARDLHDSVTQLLFSMTLIAESLPSALRRDPAEGERRAERLHDLSRAALTEMRALLAELRPLSESPPPDDAALSESLPEALQRWVSHFAGANAACVHLDAEDISVAPPVREALLRIAGEALANAVKHAQAKKVKVKLIAAAGELILTVTDNGIGFDSGTPGREGGLGLITMRERAEALGATLQIASRPGEGTQVTVKLPQ